MRKCQCGSELNSEKYKDILRGGNWYFTVELWYCDSCGKVDDTYSYIE